MNETKDEIIVLSSTKSSEKDVKITFLGLNSGKGQATVRGVLGSSAKLKWLKEPFCFASVVFFEMGKSKVVKTADLNESFFNLTKDLDRFYTAAAMLEMLKNYDEYNVENKKVFVASLKGLKALAYSDINKTTLLAKLFSTILAESGFGELANYKTNSKLLDEIFEDVTTNETEDLGFVVLNQKEENLIIQFIKKIFLDKFGYQLKSI